MSFNVIQSCASKSGYHYLLEIVERLFLFDIGEGGLYKELYGNSYLDTGTDAIKLYSDSFLSDLDREQLLGDLSDGQQSVLVWVHDSPDSIEAAIPEVVHRLYLVRDGRAAVNALLHASVTPAIYKDRPEYKYRTIEEIYTDLEVFSIYVNRWCSHVRAYYEQRDRYCLVRLEDISTHQLIESDPRRHIKRIAEYLGLNNVTSNDVDTIVESLQFNKLQQSDSYQYRSGDPRDWKRYFTRQHEEIFKSLSGDLLIQLGYENSNNW